MLTIIHGSDIALSRKYFLTEKQKFSEASILDAEKVNITDLTQIFEGGGLFGETRYVFIEQLLTKRKKSAELKDILLYLERNANENDIFLWEGKEIEQAILKQFKKAIVKPFKLPQTLFQFLDAVKPQNGKMLISLFHKTIETTETEMVFFMLIRQCRTLLALSDVIPAKAGIQTNIRHSGERMRLQNPYSGQARMTEPIDEVKRMAPWQKEKLQKQAKLFDLIHLLDLYERLFQIEIAQKTGGLSSPLVSTIDFFLLEV